MSLLRGGLFRNQRLLFPRIQYPGHSYKRDISQNLISVLSRVQENDPIVTDQNQRMKEINKDLTRLMVQRNIKGFLDKVSEIRQQGLPITSQIYQKLLFSTSILSKYDSDGPARLEMIINQMNKDSVAIGQKSVYFLIKSYATGMHTFFIAEIVIFWIIIIT